MFLKSNKIRFINPPPPLGYTHRIICIYNFCLCINAQLKGVRTGDATVCLHTVDWGENFFLGHDMNEVPKNKIFKKEKITTN